jgi:hypothetical protein
MSVRLRVGGLGWDRAAGRSLFQPSKPAGKKYHLLDEVDAPLSEV